MARVEPEVCGVLKPFLINSQVGHPEASIKQLKLLGSLPLVLSSVGGSFGLHVSWTHCQGHRLVEDFKACGRKGLNPSLPLQPPTLRLHPKTPRNWCMKSWLRWEWSVIRIFSPGCRDICRRGEGSARSSQTTVWGSILGEEVPCWWRQAPHWALHLMGQRDGAGATQLGPGPGRPAKQGCISSPGPVLSPHHPLGTSCPGCGPLASSSLAGLPSLFPRASILLGLAPPRAAVPSGFACPAQP